MALLQIDTSIEVEILSVVFRTNDDRFVVARVRDDSLREHILVGELGPVTSGERVRARGRWSEHAVHGKQFQAMMVVPVLPTTRAGIARYLGSGLVSGVGPELAQRIVEVFGNDTLEIIASQSARLREVSGIGKKRAVAIAESVRTRRDEAEALAFLHTLGLGPGNARRVLKRYGHQTVPVVKADPYVLAEDVRGVGFKTADQSARSLGIGLRDPRRTRAALLHLLRAAKDEGHMFLPRTDLLARAEGLEVDLAGAIAAFDDLIKENLIHIEDEAVYAAELWDAEVELARLIARFAQPRPLSTRDSNAERAAARLIDAAELSDEQKGAVKTSLTTGLMVLTGGPGTGKTTTVRTLLKAHQACDHRVLLAAPTGRAAKRLTETTGHVASTIHRLLAWSPNTGGFERNEEKPLEAELVLVDEASMLDTPLALALMRAIPQTARVVFVGDVDQLPPVGPGPVLQEIIASTAAQVVRLSHVFRQAQQSDIVRAAHSVRRAEVPEPTARGARTDGDVFYIECADPEALPAKLVEAVKRVKPGYGLDPRRDVQVLTPMRRGPVGTELLNRALQAALNPPRDNALPPKPPVVSDKAGSDVRPTLRVGDKVMQLRNDYDRDVYNGDLGEVRHIEAGVHYIVFDEREVKYGTDDLDDVALAYATTVHKAQGSEFPAVVIVLHTSQYIMLNRALLYTALTRARKLAVIIGDRRALVRAVRENESRERCTRLAVRIARAASQD